MVVENIQINTNYTSKILNTKYIKFEQLQYNLHEIGNITILTNELLYNWSTYYTNVFNQLKVTQVLVQYL
jgi:hypothetical protein